ncbi:MAG: chromosome condensation regulator, partial [Rariglobus sp.]|nr:chromosome condensation regulator [Rariglobus sp.]
GMPNSWEVAHGLDPASANDAGDDFDRDGLTNLREYEAETDPVKYDTDGDGFGDGVEQALSMNPRQPFAFESLEPWTLASVGAVEGMGTAALLGEGSYLFSGEGGALGTSTGDVWRFLHRNVAGNFELIAQASEIENDVGVAGWAIRASIDAQSPAITFSANVSAGYEVQHRALAGATSLRLASGVVPADGYWFKMRRDGADISTYASSDGTNWTLLQGVSTGLPSSCLVGFAVWSEDGRPVTRRFSHVQLKIDADADGLFDSEEVQLGTNPHNPDSDGDGLKDGDEIIRGTLPLNPDSDADGLPDGWEVTHGLSPLNADDITADGDGDGFNSDMEYRLGRDPTHDDRVGIMTAAGGDQSGWVSADGVAHVWGRNSNGQLGLNDAVDRAVMAPFQNPGLFLTALVWGEGHGLAITLENQVLSWGGNYFGQLGDGTRTNQRVPVAVPGLEKIVQVAAGDHHSLALRGDGTVWVWGGNQRGQLGDNSTASRLQPVMVASLSQIMAIAAGASHSVALGADGRVWVWGANDFGQLGEASVAERLTPQVLADLAPVQKIASGRHHVLALERTGSVRAWGANQSGQLGQGSYTGQASPQLVSGLSNIRSIAAGAGFSLGLEEGGFAWSWGANDLGQLGDDSASFDDPLPAVLTLTLVAEVAAGRDHAVARLNDGALLSWGLNDHGQLGSPSPEPFVRVPQAVTPPQN